MKYNIHKTLLEFSDINEVNKNIESNFGSHDIYKISLAYGYPGIAVLMKEKIIGQLLINF